MGTFYSPLHPEKSTLLFRLPNLPAILQIVKAISCNYYTLKIFISNVFLVYPSQEATKCSAVSFSLNQLQIDFFSQSLKDIHLKYNDLLKYLSSLLSLPNSISNLFLPSINLFGNIFKLFNPLQVFLLGQVPNHLSYLFASKLPVKVEDSTVDWIPPWPGTYFPMLMAVK